MEKEPMSHDKATTMVMKCVTLTSMPASEIKYKNTILMQNKLPNMVFILTKLSTK